MIQKKEKHEKTSIYYKANNILSLVFIIMLLLVLRVWHLAVFQHDEQEKRATTPQLRAVVQAAERGCIYDRFNTPLAINQIQYNVAILYSQIRQVPYFLREKDPKTGKIVKKRNRRNYVEKFVKFLSRELCLDEQNIEDSIYAKAAIFPNVPFVIKENISEEQYFKFKMLEREWPGLFATFVPRRVYPQANVGANIVGYMGAISQEQYRAHTNEKKALENYIVGYEGGIISEFSPTIKNAYDATLRLEELRERSYAINDFVGKMGIEKKYDEQLHGFYGKKLYDTDARGNFLKELPESKVPVAGSKLRLSISSELQQYAEELLALNEEIRDGKSFAFDEKEKKLTYFKQPWVKGGAIVVMDPNNGEILALASHPRYDPNDFISKNNQKICRWLESEQHIADIWDRKDCLRRERCDEESLDLTLENYLKLLLPAQSIVKLGLQRVKTVKNAVMFQRCIKKLLDISGQDNVLKLLNILYRGSNHITHKDTTSQRERAAILRILELAGDEFIWLRRDLDRNLSDIPSNYDKLLLIDLQRLIAPKEKFSDELLLAMGNQTLSFYRDISGAVICIEEIVRSMVEKLYHERDFKNWRSENVRKFLKEKRKLEKKQKTYQRPYTHYLSKEEKSQFQFFWQQYKDYFLSVFLTGRADVYNDEISFYVDHFMIWEKELSSGAHSQAYWYEKYKAIKRVAVNWNLEILIKYLSSVRSFKDLDRPLLGKYRNLRNSNGMQLEKHLAAAFYPLDGFGYSRSYAFNYAIAPGSVFKLVTSYAWLSQLYNDGQDLDSFHMIDRKYVDDNGNWFVGALMDETPIPRFYRGGLLLRSSRKNIGKIDLLRALETSSNPYFSLAAAKLKHPEVLNEVARSFSFGAKTGLNLPGEYSGRLPSDLAINKTGLYAMADGQHTLMVSPLQVAVMLSAIANGGKVLEPQILCGEKTKVVRDIPLPDEIRDAILKGMKRVVTGVDGSARPDRMRCYYQHPDALEAYSKLQNQIVAKTGTAEVVERVDVDLHRGNNLYNHIWCAGVVFEEDIESNNFPKPELVVIVHLRFGNYGKEAAPLVAQVAQKWRDIKQSQ